MTDAPAAPLATRRAAAVRALRTDRSLAVVVVAAAVGLVARVVWVVEAARPPRGLRDPVVYVEYAQTIADGKGMIDPFSNQPTAYYPPGYPWFLGTIEWICSHTPLPDDLPLVAGLIQAVLGALSVVLVGLLGRRLHSPAAGAVAAVVVAVMPNLVLHSATLLGETLTIALLLGLLVALVPPVGAEPWPAGTTRSRLIAAGVLMGLVLLVRPVAAGVLGAVVACWLLGGLGWRRTLAWTGVLIGLAALCVAPWTVRNAVRMDAFIPLSTNTGDNLCIGHAPGATGAFRLLEECEKTRPRGLLDGPAAEVADDKENTERGLRGWREGWRNEPGLTARRFEATIGRDDDALRAVQSYDLDPWMDDGLESTLSRASNASWFVVGLVGLVGLVRLAWSREGGRLLVPLTVIAVLVAPLLTFGDPRFKVPIVPLMALAAAVAVTPRRTRAVRPTDTDPVAEPAVSDASSAASTISAR